MANKTQLRPPFPVGKILGGIVAAASSVLIFAGWFRALPLNQRYFLSAYLKAELYSMQFWRADPIVTVGHWTGSARAMAQILEHNVFGGSPPVTWLVWPFSLSIGWLIVLLLLGDRFDAKRLLHFRGPRQIRGPQMVTPYEFNRRIQGDGLSLVLANKVPLWQRWSGDKAYRISIKQSHESEHFEVIGDPGKGKTLCFFQWADQAEWQGDTAIIYDPHREFIQRYYDESRGDIILNPLDARCPSWCPTWELDLNDKAAAEAVALAQAESLYPGSPRDKDWFFTNTARLIYKHLLVEYQPESARELGTWMQHPDPQIDMRVLNTELEQMLAINAAPQRAGILSTVTQPAFALRQLPDVSSDHKRWSVKEWCNRRKGWIFLTSTHDTRLALRPIQSMWINMLILRIMAMGKNPDLPMTRLFLDELPTLQHLPQLASVLTESRKAGLSVFIGFQGRSQIKALYGEQSETIFAAPTTKVLLATKEPEAADWMSRMVGETEVEQIRESRSDGGRNKRSKTFATETKEKRLVLASQFIGLLERAGHFLYSDMVVPIQIPILPERHIAESFIPAQSRPAEKATVISVEDYKNSRQAERNDLQSQGKLPLDSDKLDPPAEVEPSKAKPRRVAGGKG